MKKYGTLLLLVLVSGLGGLIWWGVKQNDQQSSVRYDHDFAVPDTASIGRIFMADRHGNRTTLVRTSATTWTVNDTWKARPTAIKNLLNAVAKIQMQYIPPQAAVPGMVRSLAADGIKVELYDQREKLLKSYYVGGATPDERGVYMILEGSEKPFVCHIPGWEGNPRFRYNLWGEDWRDRNVFQLAYSDISKVSIDYPQQRDLSFTLLTPNTLTPLHRTTPKIQQQPEEQKIQSFLVGFESLGAEAFLNDFEKKDSIRRQLPFCVMELTLKDGRTQGVALYPIQPERIYDADGKVVQASNTIERYYADCKNGDFLLVQHRVFKKVLWAYSYFY